MAGNRTGRFMGGLRLRVGLDLARLTLAVPLALRRVRFGAPGPASAVAVKGIDALDPVPGVLLPPPEISTAVRAARNRLTAAGSDTLSAQEYMALCLLAPLVWGGCWRWRSWAHSRRRRHGRRRRPGRRIVPVDGLLPALLAENAVLLRHREILRALPFVMDLLTISVEAGLDFMTAIRNIIERRKTDALGEELGRVLFEIQLGKTRREALRHMAGGLTSRTFIRW